MNALLYRFRRPTRRLLLLVPLLLFTGCPESYRADTILHSDGSIDRVIFQPNGSTPEAARPPDVWIGFQADSPADEWPKKISGFPSDPGKEHILRWGKFPAVDKIPSYYQTPLEGQQVSRLERRYTQTDLVFASKHLWQETLTEVVDLNDAHFAAKEIVHALAELTAEVLAERLENKYDCSAIVSWADDEGLQWFFELYHLLVQVSFRRESERQQVLLQRFQQICAAHGLKLPESPDGQPLDLNTHISPAVRAFVRAKLIELVRQPDGTPLTEALADAIIHEATVSTQNAPPEDEPRPTQLELAFKRVAIRRNGSEEAFRQQFEARMGPLATRVLGVHLLNMAPHQFRYSMHFPGFVVETNGLIKTPHDVQWMFDADLAFPAGYTMHCESIEPNAETQRELLGHEPLANQTAVLAYRNLLSERPNILEVLEECRAKKSMRPLAALRDQPGELGGTARLLCELLGVKTN